MKRYITLAVVVLTLPGCAAIFTSASQDISVTSTPSRAQCELFRSGATIGQLTTPNTITVDKTKHDMVIECRKAGYQKATYHNNSGIEPWVFGNIILGGFIGWGIDSAIGADNKYTSPVNISMVPLPRSGPARSGPLQSRPQTSQLPSTPYPGSAQSPGAMIPGPGAAASYGVLFASYDSVAQAGEGWKQTWNQHWSVLSGVTPYIEYGTVGNSATRYNLYGKTATRDKASRLCQDLRQRGTGCTMVYF